MTATISDIVLGLGIGIIAAFVLGYVCYDLYYVVSTRVKRKRRQEPKL